MRSRFGWYQWVAVAVAIVLLGAVIAQALNEHTWGPIWQVGWLPAVLVATLGTRRTPGRCWPRSRQPSDR